MIINTESPDQPEVAALLARLDAYCAGFGDYAPDPLSVFMERRL
jgi:hypothetical protein